MPRELDAFIDVIKSREADKVILESAKETYKNELNAVEKYAVDVGVSVLDGLKDKFKTKNNKDTELKSSKPELTQRQKGNNLFNDVGCDFKGTYLRVDKPLNKAKTASIYSDIGPTRQNFGIEYAKDDSGIRVGLEHKHSVAAGVVGYNYDTGVGKLSIDAKVSKDVSGIGASYRENGFKVNASLWQGEGVLVNFEKNMKLKNADVTFGGAVSNDYGFVYGRIVL